MAPKPSSQDSDPENPTPSETIGGCPPEPLPDPVVIPPFDVVDYMEVEPTSINIDLEIKTDFD